MSSDIEQNIPEHVVAEMAAIVMSSADVPSKLESLMCIETLSTLSDEAWSEVALYLVEINQALQEREGDTVLSF
jgi:hypothetical protein